jgi:hypothetical protein
MMPPRRNASNIGVPPPPHIMARLSQAEQARIKAAWKARKALMPPAEGGWKSRFQTWETRQVPSAAAIAATFRPAGWKGGRFAGNFTGAGTGVRMVGAAADNPMQAGVTMTARQGLGKRWAIGNDDGLAGWGASISRDARARRAAQAAKIAKQAAADQSRGLTPLDELQRRVEARYAAAGLPFRFPSDSSARTFREFWAKHGIQGLSQDDFSTPEGDAAVEALMAQADQRAADYNAAGDAAYAQHQSEVELRLAPTKADAPVTAAPTTAPVMTPPTVTPVTMARQPTDAEKAQLKAVAEKVGSTVKNLVANYGSLSSAAKVQAAKTEVKVAVANRNAAITNLANTQAAVERGKQTKRMLIAAAVVVGAVLLLKG